MISRDWKDLAEIVAIFAVVASLVFVGIEVRQNSIATRSATNAAVNESFIELNLAIATSRELATAIVTIADNSSEAPDADRLQVLALWRAIFHVWSNVHRQHMNGTLDPALYEALVQEVLTHTGKAQDFESPDGIERRAIQMRWAWESERFVFNSDFQKFVDEKLGINR
jgi:hypothetical protein